MELILIKLKRKSKSNIIINKEPSTIQVINSLIFIYFSLDFHHNSFDYEQHYWNKQHDFKNLSDYFIHRIDYLHSPFHLMTIQI